MAKKIWYSKPLKLFWQKLYSNQRKFTPKLTELQIFDVLRNNLLKAPLRPGETLETRELLISGLELWKEDCTGNFLHIFFLDRDLRDFLETTSLSDLDGLRSYLYENGENRNVIYAKTKEQMGCVSYTFGLHIPFESNGHAFSLTLLEDSSIELFFSHGDQNGRMSNTFYRELNRRGDEQSIALCKMFRLAINTLAYMKCFPECVSEGVPPTTHEKHKEHADKCITFQLSDKITESQNTPRAVIPHFRKGYFKTLRSDYYKSNKGQIIYVTETMVKGKAKTVSTATEIQRFNNGSENETSKKNGID